jgi:aromatic-L-amino-acid decarboxylase
MDADRQNREIVADLQESGIAAPSTTVIAGKSAIRAAIVNHRTRDDDVDAMVDAVLHFAGMRQMLPPG